MKYTHYSVEDFVKDEYFQKWVLDTDTMTSNFWNTWIEKHPEKNELVNEAKRLIRLMSFEENKLSNTDFDEMWQHIIQKRKSEQVFTEAPIKRKSKVFYWKYTAVASIFIIGMVSFFLYQNNNLASSIEPEIAKNEIETGNNKAVLTLSDGSNVSLQKGKNYTSNNVASNGEEIVYNKKPSKKTTYNYLTIPRGGHFSIKLSDGTKVWLNSESQLKYPTAFTKGESRKVELVYGEAYFDISPSTDHNGDDFKVINNTQEIHVLGTEFNVKAYKDEPNIYTTLVEGKVALSYNNKKLNLVPNQQSIVNSNNHNLLVKTIDVYNEISWKEGVFSFENKPLKEIMKVLSRWYDMDVIFKNKEIEKEEFIGVLEKNQKIEEILTSIKNLGVIKNYEIKNKRVILE